MSRVDQRAFDGGRGRIVRARARRGIPLRKAVAAALVLWIACWALVFAVNARREHVGRLGAAEWAPRAADARIAPADRDRAAATAAFEADVAARAAPWVRLSLGLGLALPAGIAALLCTPRRRRRPVTIGPSRRRAF